MSAFLKSQTNFAERLHARLATLLPEPEGAQSSVMEAMRYAVLGGGKRVRPFLLVETARMLGYDNDGALTAGAALECLHTYSLVHDDLPCMDDDDVRRGRATVHKAFDEMTAVLAGDGLLTLAFELMARDEVHPDPAVRLTLVSDLAKASGSFGMIGGQVMDMKVSETDRSETIITELQAMKTGALIEFACVAGAKLADADETTIQTMRAYAQDLGLAFQIKDDILDAEGDAAIMGKAARKDNALGKATFVSILGLEAARDKADMLGGQAKARLAEFVDRAEILRDTVDFILSRDK